MRTLNKETRTAKKFFVPGDEEGIERVVNGLPSIIDTHDVYFGVAPRDTAGEPVYVRWLWADIDSKCEGVEQNYEDADIVVRSGTGGVHAYWALDRIADFQYIGRERFRDACRLWVAARWPDSDAVNDTARILRIPGTINHKNGAVVTLERCNENAFS